MAFVCSSITLCLGASDWREQFARTKSDKSVHFFCPAFLLYYKGAYKQPRRRRQQKPHKFVYLTMKNRIFARAFFIFWHFVDVLVLSTTWNDLFYSCLDNASVWWQMFNFVLSCPKRLFQFNSSIVRTHFSSITSLNNWKMKRESTFSDDVLAFVDVVFA